jgi:hypothetical protein
MTTRHGTLARMFLRSCAVLTRLYGGKDAGWLRTYATLSVSATVMSVAFLVMVLAAILLRNEFPTSVIVSFVIWLASVIALAVV